MTVNESSAIAFTKEMAQSIWECDREFPIDLDEAWQWLGYNQKSDCLSKLKRNFEEGDDFSVKSLKSPTGGRPSACIMLTVDCFKSLGMLAGTSQGNQIRKYFLQCERVAKAMSLPKKEPSLCTTETGLLKLGKLVRSHRESLKRLKGLHIKRSHNILMTQKSLHLLVKVSGMLVELNHS